MNILRGSVRPLRVFSDIVAQTKIESPIRSAHVVAAIGHEAAGPSYSVPRLCEALVACGIDTELHVGDSSLAHEREFPIHLHETTGPFKSRLGFSPSMRDGLRIAARRCDVIHNHGLWMMPNIYPWQAVDGTDCRLVVAPRGTLSPQALARSRFRKWIMWTIAQRQLLKRADCFHATAEGELDDIRRAGFKQPVAVIPNGVEVPVDCAEFTSNGPPRFLFFARIHPIKALDRLLHAWANFEKQVPDWELWIGGAGDTSYVEQMRRLSEQKLLQRVRFVGPKYGAEKSELYRSAHVYVLPSYSENFGMTIAEALAAGLPVIASRGAPWAKLKERECGWWIANDEQSILQSLIEAARLDVGTLKTMGLRGRQWMRDEFSWERIGRMMAEVYCWQVERQDRPQCIA